MNLPRPNLEPAEAPGAATVRIAMIVEYPGWILCRDIGRRQQASTVDNR